MPTAKKPQDHKPADGSIKFKAGRKTYTLPPATEAVKNMSGRDLQEVIMGGEQGEISFGFRILRASDVSDETRDALLDKPMAECLEILGEWVQAVDLDGVSVPQS